ncbi:MAG: MarR family winged helix-turn-helix transcriptional regulator [Alphaproteobacteria bacterium]|nr:MarR family winged helix-turn-helix transcriptional regulator [Alphaproteobacteria bacterium]
MNAIQNPKEYRLENILGALALTLADRITAEAETVTGIGGIGASILIAIRSDPGILIEHLAGQQNKSQSTIVRAVQQLEQRNLVSKSAGTDRRTMKLMLTDAGMSCADSILNARESLLTKTLKRLTGTQRSELEQIVEKMLVNLIDHPKDAFPMCRLCREECCGDDLDCPVERGAAAKER